MKKFLFFTMLVAVIFSSCKQELTGPDPDADLQEVVFIGANAGNGGTLKDGRTLKDETDCSLNADYAMIVIDGETYYALTFIVNDVLYTQAIKLNANVTYHLEEFILFHDGGTPGFSVANRADDIEISAVPHEGSNFGELVLNPLDLEFTLDPFEKRQVIIELLCLEESNYDDFGFIWFQPEITLVQQIWIFGDFCTKFYEEYQGSLYENQSGGLQVDMPAIYEIEVYHNGDYEATYSNADTFGETPLAVLYIDRPEITDNYELRVNILVKVGNSFEYKYFGSWTFTDDGLQIVTQQGVGPGPDGVYDFVLGNCNAESADIAFAPYMNLPDGATMRVDFSSPTMGTYMDIYLSSFMKYDDLGVLQPVSDTGYDLTEGIWGGFCFDRQIYIYGDNYEVFVYSSLYPDLMPAFLQAKRWDRANWLANHLEDYPGHTWQDIQQVIWRLDGHNGSAAGGVPPITSLGTTMYNDAVAYGDGYVPLPGGWAAVPFIKRTDVNAQAPSIQTVFTIVDP